MLIDWLVFGFRALPLLLPVLAFGHGEDKPGPNGGYIRMPGAFHTEVVPEKESFRVYLLDVAWQNPTVKNSYVRYSGTGQKEIRCRAKKTYFLCPFPKGVKLDKGRLQISSQREGTTGADALYDLPLKFSTPASPHH